jgi:hypothetical protein
MSNTRYSVYTLIDITSTQVISNTNTDTFARNQQRNWETAQQIIGLRTQATIVAVPASPRTVYMDAHEFGSYYKGQHQCWKFIFEVEQTDIFGNNDDPVKLLRQDFDSVPIIKNLAETIDLPDPVFYTEGLLKNTYFKIFI